MVSTMLSSMYDNLPSSSSNGDQKPLGESFKTIFEGKEALLLKDGAETALKPGFSWHSSENKEESPEWKNLPGNAFMVRTGPDYVKKKMKKPSAPPFYECVAVDTFASPKKISNIGRFFYPKSTKSNKNKETAEIKSNGGENQDVNEDVEEEVFGVPENFILQLQLPDYTPSAWGQAPGDGVGYSLVFHYKLTSTAEKQLREGKLPAAKLLSRFVDACRMCGGPQKNEHPLYLRPKVIMRLLNHEEIGLGFMHRKICENYNAKPFLSRPEHTFHMAEDNSYLEIDVDVHLFGYLQRKTAFSFRDKFCKAIIDIGIVIEGQANNELPEKMLAACQIQRILHKKFCLVSVEGDEEVEGTRKSTLTESARAKTTPPAPTMHAPPPPPTIKDATYSARGVPENTPEEKGAGAEAEPAGQAGKSLSSRMYEQLNRLKW
mmetsp:Transcript_6587/g.12131  ORF Transcript_6587/g.12131 Transcript_6587/m.12131 type:complete len:433 (+) Transcript_6587:190-1488(+)